MPLLVRKIDKAKWMQNDILSGEDVSADAITHDLKTKDNTLSAWLVEEVAIENAVLAIVSSHEHLDTIDVVCMDPPSLESKGIMLELTPGNTPVEDLSSQHIDICALTYQTLGAVADHVVHNLKNEKDKRYTKGMIKKLLIGAIKGGRLQMDALHESLRKKL